MKNIIRYIFALLAALWYVIPVSAQEKNVPLLSEVETAPRPLTPQEAVDRFARLPSVDSTNVAVLITDLRTGRTIGEWNPRQPLIPASIQKAVTTATLLSIAGKDWRYRTDAYVTGPVHDGTLEGNILIKASGDPSLNSAKTPFTADFTADVETAIIQKGIDSIAGRIIVDQSLFQGPAVPPTWARGDLPHAYGTGCHGFNFANNASGKASVADPAGVFISRLTKALAAKGIRIGGNEIRDGRKGLISKHLSAPLDEIMRSCMMRSDNLYAEALLQTIPIAEGEEVSSTGKALSIERNFWKKKRADMEGVEIFDGSGLSRSNRVTARFMTDVLTRMKGDPYYASFFPLAGREGTLRSLLANTPLAEYIAMKTGSMNGIQCYAGYMLDDDYAPTHTVVIIVNRMKGARYDVRKGVEQMLLTIFRPE